jgi:hypothetical protein
MNDTNNKRNRAGNFVQEDTELFIALVKDNRKLIESGKDSSFFSTHTIVVFLNNLNISLLI